MEVLTPICLFSFIGVVCSGMIALLFVEIDTIFENYFLSDVCDIAIKVCLLALVISAIATIISGVLLLTFSCTSFQLLGRVSE